MHQEYNFIYQEMGPRKDWSDSLEIKRDTNTKIKKHIFVKSNASLHRSESKTHLRKTNNFLASTKNLKKKKCQLPKQILCCSVIHIKLIQLHVICLCVCVCKCKYL